jgi:hypothetical protein
MQGIKYNVDIVLCIDATGSMSGIIEKVKANALKFYEDLLHAMQEKDKVIDNLRVKVIPFRDYYVDGDRSMDESPFFALPADKEAFATYLSGVKADGGGDEPENGLEALSLAMNSAWTTEGDKRRQIIVMWTDASAHPLDKNSGAKPSNYPPGMPANFNDLTDVWEGQGPMNFSAKRFIVYAPDANPWTDISNHWENTVHYPSKAGQGLLEVDYRSIIDAIANSV